MQPNMILLSIDIGQRYCENRKRNAKHFHTEYREIKMLQHIPMCGCIKFSCPLLWILSNSVKYHRKKGKENPRTRGSQNLCAKRPIQIIREQETKWELIEMKSCRNWSDHKNLPRVLVIEIRKKSWNKTAIPDPDHPRVLCIKRKEACAWGFWQLRHLEREEGEEGDSCEKLGPGRRKMGSRSGRKRKSPLAITPPAERRAAALI